MYIVELKSELKDTQFALEEAENQCTALKDKGNYSINNYPN